MTDQTAAGKGRGSTAKGRGNAAQGRGNAAQGRGNAAQGRGNAAQGRGNGAEVPAQSAGKAPKPAAQGPQVPEGGAAQEPSARAVLGGWLEGPHLHDGDAVGYRGERLGLPESGPGALAGQGRRLGALVVDWVVALLIVAAIGWHPTSGQGQWGVLAVFAAEHLLLVSTLGFTIGKRLFGLRVGKLGGPLTPLNVIVRTVLLMLVIPAVIWDRDGRGLHDRLAGTVELQREV